MAVGRIDYVARNWSTIQREAELGVAESVSFLPVTTPATRMVNATHRGRFTCKQGYSPLGWNESVEILRAPDSSLRGGQGQEQFYCIGFHVPSDWASPSGWGYIHQWYSIVAANSGGPALGLQLRGVGAGNGTNLGGFFMVRAGGSPSVSEGMTRKTFPFDLAAATDYCFIVYVRWSAYSNAYDLANNAPPGAEVVGQLRIWEMQGTETDFTLIVDEPDIPTLQRAEGQPCFPGTIPPGAAGSGTPCSVTYFKHGLYRGSKCNKAAGTTNIGALQNTTADLVSRCQYGASGTQPDSIVYHDPPAWCDTLTEARAEFGVGPEGGGGTDPDVDASLPALSGSDVRYGNSTLYTGRGTLTADRKRACKVTVTADTDIHTIRYGVEITGSGTQAVRLDIHDDDVAGGEPGTEKAESSDKTLTGPLTVGWLERLITPVTLVAGDYWVSAHAGATSAVISQCQETVNGALRFNDDVFTGGTTDPFGAATTGNARFAIVLEGTPTGGGGGGGSGDTQEPLLAASESFVDGDVIELRYDEPLDTLSVPVPGDFTVSP